MATRWSMPADGKHAGAARKLALAGIGAGVLMGGFLSLRPTRAADKPAYHVIKKIKLGGEGGWDYLLMDPGARRLYVSHSDRVVVLDPDTGNKVGEILNTPGVHGVALAPKLGRGFTSNGRENTVTVFDLKSLKELDRVNVGTNPDCIIYDAASGHVFTLNGQSHDATVLDPATGKVVGSIALGGKPEFAVADGLGKVFVNIEDTSEIVALDARKLTVLQRWSVAPGEEPSGLALDAKHQRLFAVCSNQKMAVVDLISGRVVATPAIGHGPDAAAFDDRRQLAFSSNGQDGTLTIIHERSPSEFEVLGTIPTQLGARTMAFDRKTRRIYLATADVASPPAGAPAPRRPNYTPGSFTILVLGE